MPTSLETRTRLEAALREPKGMTYDNLVVYADFLQGEADIRGELISLDLVAPKDRYAAAATAWRQRRQAVLAEWLGPALAEEVEEHFDLGFVKQLDERASLALLASKAGEYIRAFTVEVQKRVGPEAEITQRITALASRSRPWLQRLEIVGNSYESGFMIDDSIVRDLIEATPMLARALFGGVRVIAKFPHPTLRYLSITSPYAVTGLFDEDFAFVVPEVVHLELGIERGIPEGFALAKKMFPKLASLDLKRASSDQDVLFDAIAAQPICDQIRVLDLPAFTDDNAVAAATRMLDAMPNLGSVKVARTYGRAAVGHEEMKTRRVELPVPFPWPSPETLKSYNSLVVRIPDEPYDDIVAMPSLVAFLEKRFESFSDEAKQAWSRIWDAIRPVETTYTEDGEWIEPPVPPQLTIATVSVAIDACEQLTSAESRTWSEFRAHWKHSVLGLTEDAVIKMSIYRG